MNKGRSRLGPRVLFVLFCPLLSFHLFPFFPLLLRLNLVYFHLTLFFTTPGQVLIASQAAAASPPFNV